MGSTSCSIDIKTDHKHPHRAVAFLKKEGVSFVNIDEAFQNLDEDAQDYFSTSFDYWIDGRDRKHRYHGWDKSQYGGEYQQCFVFKHPPHRLYGFLCHPKEPKDTRFWACVLVLHAEKKKWKTDVEELKRAEKMRQDPEVQAECRREFSKED